MRIRTQLMVSAAITLAVSIVLGVGLLVVTAQARVGVEEQAEAQEVARQISNMLSLTNEYTVYGSERAADQWRQRDEQLKRDLAEAMVRRTPPSPVLVELQRKVTALSPIFDTLVAIGPTPSTTLGQRRRDLLLERLLIQTQEVVETRHQWALHISADQQRDRRHYTFMVLAAPAALLLLLVSLGVLVGRGILRPLARLEQAAIAIQAGQLEVRCASDAPDELGDAARAVDAMARALQGQGAALHASEKRLRLITSNVPALIAYIDRDERYTFVNGRAGLPSTTTAEGDLGLTLRETHQEHAYARIQPYVNAALMGHPASFESSIVCGGRNVHYQTSCVPDIRTDGRVEGFYALSFDITDRKEAEQRLAASERLLSDINDNVPALVAYIDRDHRYTFANSKYREWLGADPALMVGKHVGDAVTTEFYALARPHLESALRGERTRWERQTVQDGRSRYLVAEYIPDHAPDGTVQGCYALTIDITDRREAELVAAQTQQRLSDLTDNIPAMVGYFDMGQRCQYANKTALRTLGVDPADLPGIELRKALGEAIYLHHLPYVNEALSGRRSRLEGRTPFHGREAHYQAHLIPDRVDGGQQRGFYLMTFDITALKEAELKRERVERQLRAIADNLPVLISYIDSQERYVFLNETFQHWLGIDPRSVLGRKVADVVEPALYEPRRPLLQRALAGEPLSFDIESQTLGQHRHLQNVYIPDVQADGQVVGVYTLSTDVTPLKQIEQQLSQQARIDTLTGLPNRRQLEERMVEAAARVKRTGKNLALMFLDVDYFKSINDSLGHRAGDMVLVEFGARLRGAVRVTDMAARLAGDEFVVILEGLGAEHEAEELAAKLCAAVRLPFDIDGRSLRVTTSIGVAFCTESASGEAMMACADAALYETKTAGRNGFTVRKLEKFKATDNGTAADQLIGADGMPMQPAASA